MIGIINNNIILVSVAAFLVSAISEFFWVRWNQSVTDKKRFNAGVYGVLTYAAGSINALFIFAGVLVPLLCFYAGVFIGAFYAVGKN